MIYSGDNSIVRVNGSAHVGGVAIIELSANHSNSDTVRRVLVSASGGLDGMYSQIDLKGQQQRDTNSGRCYTYFSAGQAQQSGSLSVLLVPKEEQCKASISRTWLITGITMGVIGGLLITCGMLWVGRDVFFALGEGHTG